MYKNIYYKIFTEYIHIYTLIKNIYEFIYLHMQFIFSIEIYFLDRNAPGKLIDGPIIYSITKKRFMS